MRSTCEMNIEQVYLMMYSMIQVYGFHFMTCSSLLHMNISFHNWTHYNCDIKCHLLLFDLYLDLEFMHIAQIESNAFEEYF